MRNIMAAALVLAAALTGFAAMADDSDPYVWLEDVHGAKPLAWVAAQNAKSLGLLKADPHYQADYDSVLSVLDAPDRIAYGGLDHGFVYNFWQDAAHPKGLWRRTTIADYAAPAPHWQVLLDIDALAAKEKENWVWKGAECSPSQIHCLIRLSRGGGDAVVVREYDLKTMMLMTEYGFVLPEAKTDVSYLDDDRILFASDFGPGTLTTSGYPRIVKLWRRGEPIDEARTVFEGDVKDVASQPLVFHGSHGATALIAQATDFFHTTYHYIQHGEGVTTLPLPPGADVKGALAGNLILTLREDWSFEDTGFSKGSLLSYALEPGIDLAAAPGEVEYLDSPGERSSIEDVSVGPDAVYASIYENVIGSIHVYRFNPNVEVYGRWSDKRLDLPTGGTTAIVSTDDYGPQAQFRFENFLTPTTLYADAGDDKPVAIKSLPARFDASDMTSEQFFATSKDGTKIPYFVTRLKKLSGPAPTILYGYGGFEISLTPSYSANFGRLWLSQGGIYVVANIRGGGEFGPAWHDAALKENRQKAFDDFAAVAQDLIARGLTTPAQLGIMGGSNGGLLVSTVMVQHPELLGAVVCQVPLIDMLAFTHIGAGASWIGEYGDPAIPAERVAILKYSPYQNVKAGVKYPPVFFVTATSDDRVTPVHARKMAAKMEAQGHDVLFYENTDGGHAAAANHKQAAEMWALSFVYLAERLGLK